MSSSDEENWADLSSVAVSFEQLLDQQKTIAQGGKSRTAAQVHAGELFAAEDQPLDPVQLQVPLKIPHRFPKVILF